MEAPCVRQNIGARDICGRVAAPDVAPNSPAVMSNAVKMLRKQSPLSLDSLALPTVLVAHVFSFLALVDHIWLSRTAHRLDQVSRLPAASPERVVLNQLPPSPEFEGRFHPRGLAVVGDDGYVALDVALLAQRFPALEFLSLTNRTELCDLAQLRHLQTLCCRRVHQPAPLPLPERLTAIDYDCYSAEDATRLFCDPSSQQLRSFRVQWMRDSTPQVFPERLPDTVCAAMLRGAAALTDLRLAVDLAPTQLDAIAHAIGERLARLGLKRVCDDAPPHDETKDDDAVVDDGTSVDLGRRPTTVGGGVGGGSGNDVSERREFSALVTLSVTGWRAAVLVSRRTPALRSLEINHDATEHGPRSESRKIRVRQQYWSANNDDDGDQVATETPSADKQLRHAALTSLKISVYANRAQSRLATRLPALRRLSIVTHGEEQTIWTVPPAGPLRRHTSFGAFPLDPEIESLKIDARSVRVAPALLPPSDTLARLVLELNPTLKVGVGFSLPYPALTHLTLSGFDPAPVLASLGGCARLHTLRLQWLTMSLGEIPPRLGPILCRLLVELPNLQRLHLGPHVRANLAELRRAAARLREAFDSHSCVVSCDSSLGDGVTFEA